MGVLSNETLMSGDYSSWAKLYSRSRPQYPANLFAYLAGLCKRRERAWDCATGNGQAALALAGHFASVVATDRSAQQLSQAPRRPSVHYFQAVAERSALAEASTDLVTVAASVHWFDLPEFYRELERVLRPAGVVAVWTYHVAHVDGGIGELLWAFYRDVVSSYFSAGARLVDDRYAGIHLPGTGIDAPSFWMQADWNRNEVLTFVRSWSGTQAYIKKHSNDPTDILGEDLARLYSDKSIRRHIRWPVYLKVSRL